MRLKETKLTLSIWGDKGDRGHGEDEGEESDGVRGEILVIRKSNFKF